MNRSSSRRSLCQTRSRSRANSISLIARYELQVRGVLRLAYIAGALNYHADLLRAHRPTRDRSIFFPARRNKTWRTTARFSLTAPLNDIRNEDPKWTLAYATFVSDVCLVSVVNYKSIEKFAAFEKNKKMRRSERMELGKMTRIHEIAKSEYFTEIRSEFLILSMFHPR